MGEQVVVPLMNGKIIEATVTDTIFTTKKVREIMSNQPQIFSSTQKEKLLRIIFHWS